MATKPKTFQPVLQRRSLALSGGFAGKKTFVPETRDFTVDWMDGDVANIRDSGVPQPSAINCKGCVFISHSLPWLCEMATGQNVCQRPMARVRIVRDLMELASAGDGAQDTKDNLMQGLTFDSDSSDDFETPKKKRRSLLVSREAVRAIAGNSMILKRNLKVPESPASRDQKLSVFVVVDERGRLWLETEALPWLLNYIRAEKESGGVVAVEDSSSTVVETPTSSRIHWDFASESWRANAKDVQGNGTKRRGASSDV